VSDESISTSSELKTITYDTVKEFFERYIKNYLPYSDAKVYDTIINNLVDYYYNHAYNDIPTDFKDLFETANVTNVELYDKLLVAVGVPSELIKSLTFTDKMIFLKSLCDFQRYKASLSFVQKLGEVYSDFNKLNIYELYIDYDSTKLQPWVLKPVNIYKHEDLDLSLESLDYVSIYNQIPSLLVSVDQLNELYANNQLILPLKSNLLFLDYDLSREVSLLYDLIVTIFLKEFRNTNIELYFNDTTMSVPLEYIYYAWYYLMTRYYDTTWESSSLNFALRFAQTGLISSIPYTIDDVDNIIKEYDEIDTIDKRDKFYNTYFANILAKWEEIPDTMNHTQMLAVLATQSPNLAVYLDDRISSFEDEDNQKREINIILNEIYSSLILYSQTSEDSNFTKYFEYLMRFLPQIVINPETSSTYTILYNFKPFHVELYTQYREGILCRDKFNTAWTDDSQYAFTISIIMASIFACSDIYFFNYNYIYNSSLPILSSFTNRFEYTSSDSIEIEEMWSFMISMIAQSLMSISSQKTFSFEYFYYSSLLSVLSSFISQFSYSSSDTSRLEETWNFAVSMISQSLMSISSQETSLFNYLYYSSLSVLVSYYCLYDLLELTSEDITESLQHLEQFPGQSVLGVNALFSEILSNMPISGSDNVSVVDDYVVVY